MEVALAHDYLTQRGGAERVVLSLARAFPDVAVFTALYNPATTFPEFRQLDVRPSRLDALAPLRVHHRRALPLLAPTFSRLRIDADVVVCSSSGWAHGARTDGRKIVYCHSPAKWLYRPGDYLGTRGRLAVRAQLAAARPLLRRWDRKAAASADRYLANSSFVARQIAEVYGVEAEVVTPPVPLDADAGVEPIEHLESGFFLAVSRLLPYKNVVAVVQAFADLPEERLVVVGEGPLAEAVFTYARPNVTLLGWCSDAELRWLYASCAGLVSASREDLGLTPLEAAAFGKPAAVLRFGGFLDTVVEGLTGVFFDEPSPDAIAEAVRRLRRERWDAEAIRGHARRFSEEAFAARMRGIVYDVARG